MTIHQIEIFDSVDKANAFLAEHWVKLVSFEVKQMHDYWSGGSSYPPSTICNQWTEYILVYELEV
jgi:hypothetical protein